MWYIKHNNILCSVTLKNIAEALILLELGEEFNEKWYLNYVSSWAMFSLGRSGFEGSMGRERETKLNWKLSRQETNQHKEVKK